MRLYRFFPIVLVLLGIPVAAVGAEPASPCGRTVAVQRNDTLSGIAARCDVTEASLLRANPDIKGSGDLQAGAALHVPTGNDTGRRVGAAVGSFSRRASDAVGALADGVGSSVGDLLGKNPDLKARLDKLGSSVGLTEGETPAAVVLPQGGPPGTTVTVTANGLPPNSPVAIGAGSPGAAYSVVGHAQTAADGTMEAKVAVPGDAKDGQAVVFSVSTGAGVAARTGRFAVKW